MGITPFWVNYRYYQYYKIFARNPSPVVVPSDYRDDLTNLDKFVHREIIYAQPIQAEQVDKHTIEPLVYEVADEIWLLCRYLASNRP
jgi:hypothetical protein